MQILGEEGCAPAAGGSHRPHTYIPTTLLAVNPSVPAAVNNRFDIIGGLLYYLLVVRPGVGGYWRGPIG